jgi:Predicted membrane protein (DUF2339)
MEFWVFILTLWAFYRWMHFRIHRQKEDERFARVIETLNRHEARLDNVKKLEARVHELERRVTEAASAPVVTQSPVSSVPPSPAPEPVKPAQPIAVPPTLEIPKSPTPIAPAPSVHPIEPPPPPPPSPSPKPVATPPAPVFSPPPTSPRSIPPPFSAPSQPAQVPARERGFQLEELLGKNWLNKLGIIALVIGISMALGRAFPLLSNPAKIALSYLVSFLILGTGIYLERLDRYRVFARALLGGGWALIFFVTWAMHFLAYTRVIDTQWVDLILLFSVAAAMVVHTLRYDSQVVTGLAFLLAFTTVAISQNTFYSLSAGAILAIGLVAIVHRRQWFELEIFGILASYGNHFLWLVNVIVPMAGHHRMFPEFVPSTVLLTLYWAIYRWSYIARRIQSVTQENISTLAAILNTSLLLFLFKYQSVRPELAFYGLLVLGAAELSLGQLSATRKRRIAFIILSTIGIILLVAAIPFKYSGMDTAVIWLAEAQILLLAGVFSREILFRRFGLLVALLTSGDMLINQALPTLYDRLAQPPHGFWGYTAVVPAPDLQLAVSFLVAAVLFYASAIVLPRRWKDLISSESEEISLRALSYLAALMLGVSLWLASPNSYLAVLWAAAAFLLIVLSNAFSAEDLRYQAHLFAFAAVSRAVVVNSLLTSRLVGTTLSLRLVTLSLVIALLYLCARWLSAQQADFFLAPSELYTTAAAVLFILLAWHECNWVWIAAAWGAFAFVLAVIGFFRNRRDLSLQAHLLVLAGFVRTLLVNIDATEEWHHFTLRFLTFTLMAVLLYLCSYFSGPREADYARLFSALHTWCGSILIAVLAFKEVSSPWIAVAWAFFALLLLIIGDRVKRIQLHFQAYLLSLSALFQIVTVNLGATAPFNLFPSLSLRLVTLVIVAAIFYLCARWAAKGEFALAPFAAASYSWAASSLVVLLIDYEAAPHSVALGWALFGVALFEIGVFWKSRNWRLQSYVVFILSFFRVAVYNLDPPSSQLLFFTLPVAFLFYYVYFRLTRFTSPPSASATSAYAAVDPFALDKQVYAATFLAYLGSATLALFADSYFPGGSHLVAWAVLSLLFVGIAWSARLDVFLHHSLILAFLVSARALAFELRIGGRPSIPGDFSAVFYVSAVAAILFVAQAFAFPLRARFAAARKNAASSGSPELSLFDLTSRPEQIYFFLPFLLVTLLILNEVSFGRVTIAWGLEAVFAFLFALIVGERSFRLAALALLLLCVAKIGLLDVWRLHGSDRYITLIILGIALLLVSYLYTRYSEPIRRYL